jgi:hypothetical protein
MRSKATAVLGKIMGQNSARDRTVSEFAYSIDVKFDDGLSGLIHLLQRRSPHHILDHRSTLRYLRPYLLYPTNIDHLTCPQLLTCSSIRHPLPILANPFRQYKPHLKVLAKRKMMTVTMIGRQW